MGPQVPRFYGQALGMHRIFQHVLSNNPRGSQEPLCHDIPDMLPVFDLVGKAEYSLSATPAVLDTSRVLFRYYPFVEQLHQYGHIGTRRGHIQPISIAAIIKGHNRLPVVALCHEMKGPRGVELQSNPRQSCQIP